MACSGLIATRRPPRSGCRTRSTCGIATQQDTPQKILVSDPPCPQAAARQRLHDEIHLRYGQQLFGRGRYEEALAHFGQSSLAGPAQLLALFPSLVPRRLLEAAAQAAGGAALGAGRRWGLASAWGGGWGAEPAIACLLVYGSI
jgi:hypothetical protein